MQFHVGEIRAQTIAWEFLFQTWLVEWLLRICLGLMLLISAEFKYSTICNSKIPPYFYSFGCIVSLLSASPVQKSAVAGDCNQRPSIWELSCFEDDLSALTIKLNILGMYLGSTHRVSSHWMLYPAQFGVEKLGPWLLGWLCGFAFLLVRTTLMWSWICWRGSHREWLTVTCLENCPLIRWMNRFDVKIGWYCMRWSLQIYTTDPGHNSFQLQGVTRQCSRTWINLTIQSAVISGQL